MEFCVEKNIRKFILVGAALFFAYFFVEALFADSSFRRALNQYFFKMNKLGVYNHFVFTQDLEPFIPLDNAMILEPQVNFLKNRDHDLARSFQFQAFEGNALFRKNGIFAVSEGGRISKLNQDQKTIWSYQIWEQPYSGVAGLIDDQTSLVTVTQRGVLLRLKKENGAPIWKTQLMSRVVCGPFLYQGGIYLCTDRGDGKFAESAFVTVDFASGKIHNSQQIPKTLGQKSLFVSESGSVCLKVNQEIICP